MKSNRQIPRGIEVLVKKASVDSAFCELLIDKRADAANDIGLTLSDAETAMLKAIPEAQLIGIIRKTKVSRKARPAFMGYVATAMLATLGITTGYAEAEESDSETISTSEDDETDNNNKMQRKTVNYHTTLGIRPSTDEERELNRKFTLTTSIISISGTSFNNEGRTESDISRIIEQRKAGVEYLYRKHKKSNPDLPEGIIVYSFDIIDDGSVKEVIVESDEIGNEALYKRIAARIGTWKFHPNSGEVTVVVSFEFSVDE